MLPIQIDHNIAENLFDEAIFMASKKKFDGDIKVTQNALRQGQCDVCRLVSNLLVTKIGDYLSQFEKTVKVIYQYEPEHINFEKLNNGTLHSMSKSGLNLIARVERKSAALLTLVASLETSLMEVRRQWGCTNSTSECFVLDIQLIDDRDVMDNRGLGMMANSLYVRSYPAWKREEKNGESPLDGKNGLVGDPKELLALNDSDLIPEGALFEQAFSIDKMAHREKKYYEHHASEIKVALIKRIISDQLAYINIAKRYFSLEDLWDIDQRRIGFGKIGGKAAGLMLASRIISESGSEADLSSIHVPESYFIGADTCYIFMAMNGLMHWNDEKYKNEDQIWQDYPQICEEFQGGDFPPEIHYSLEKLLKKIGDKPIIVRSSSQLEDNFGTSFAGKYESVICANQGTIEQNLSCLKDAIACIYASTLKPEALLYRRNKGLQDYDERMAVILQVVEGETFGRYYLPYCSGVAFSRNLFRWAPQIKKEEGFARLVWGLGTRAVQRVGDDFTRLVALSHPTLQPDDAPDAIRYYSQQYVDVIDLEENTFKTLPAADVMKPDYAGLNLMAQRYESGYLSSLRSRILESEIPSLSITYHELLQRTDMALTLSNLLKVLEKQYQIAVDIEFTARVKDPLTYHPEVIISLLQCRPQSYIGSGVPVSLPENIPDDKIIFTTQFMVPHGYLRNIQYVLYIPAEQYYSLDSAADRNALSRLISRINAKLPYKGFICVGPGRWGTTNHDLGVYVSYADIHKSAALVELSGGGTGLPPEPSLGTHFFQDLMEAQIYPIAINLDAEGVIFNHKFFKEAPNILSDWIDVDNKLMNCLKLIAVGQYQSGSTMEILMDDEKGKAIAMLNPHQDS